MLSLRLRLSLLAVLSLATLGGPSTYCQSLLPSANPNHYIILVDASGSTARPAAKKRNFDNALTEQLLPRLYDGGFGEAIPPFNPDQDYLTLNFFGVVTGSGGNAYDRLPDYNLLTDFIHSELLRGKNVSRKALAEHITPTQTYQYTILSWAKQLALYNSRPKSTGEVSHRTFLILVHDGISNENSVTEEIEMVRRWSKANFEEVWPVVNRIDNDYKFTDGSGGNKPAWTEKVDDTSGGMHAPVFIEAYEVLSTRRANWEAEGRRLDPLDDISIRWTTESGDLPEGELKAVLGEEFTAWIGLADGAELSLSVEQDSQVTRGLAPSMPFVARGSLSCDPRPFNTALSATVKQTDELLGSRVVQYTYPRVVAAPLPSRCTAVFRAARAAGVVLTLLLAAYFACLFYYRYYTTDIEIEIPGTMAPIRLERKGQPSVAVPVVPQRGLEALTLKLPGLFKQYLFHRGATVSLTPTAGEMIHWAEAGDERVIRLPLARDYVPAHWGRLPSKPSQVTVSYRKGRRQTVINLSYPSGARLGALGAQI